MDKTSEQAVGKWRGILVALGIDNSFLQDRHGPCPLCGGRDRFRFDDKDGRGSWICNQCGAGDGMSLAVKFTGAEFKYTAKRIDEIVGRVQYEKPREGRDPRVRLRKIQAAIRPAHNDPVTRYLCNRGIERLDGLKNIKTHPGMVYYTDGKPSGTYPAMINLVTKSGRGVTYHVTYLTADGDKCPHDPAKKVLPPIEKMTGGAVWFGSEDKYHIHICEGIETALAIRQWGGQPCIAATSATMLAAFEWPEECRNITIYADNDASYTGHKAAYTIANRAAVAGLGVTVLVPPSRGDYLDYFLAMETSK